MRRQREGKTWEKVKEILTARGIDTTTLEILAFGRGSYREVIIDDEIIGSYNCRSQQLVLSADVIESE